MATPFSEALSTLNDRALRRILGARAFLRGYDYVRRHAIENAAVEEASARGQVRGTDGQPIAGAIVDVWHANTKGGYSFFDPSQPAYNLRRRIQTDAEGRYRFRSILPSGYCCPPGGPTQELLDGLGRHGNRPAHIHFFVSAPGYRQLTTQINIDGDAYLHDDFALATRDGLIPAVRRVEDPADLRAREVDAPFAEIAFDFVLNPAAASVPDTIVHRDHAQAA